MNINEHLGSDGCMTDFSTITAPGNEYRRIAAAAGPSFGKQVILLNGPSSSGKSTLARALQALIREKRSETYEVVSIDDFMHTDPMETIYEDDVYEISGDLCKRVAEILDTGSGVIVDHVITSERIFNQLKETPGASPLRLVRLTCSPEILKRREQARGDRCPGSAESSAAYLYPKGGYDLVLDTGIHAPAENASAILDWFFGKA